MQDDIFVNVAMDYALTMYTRSKERKFSPLYNTFLVVVIRALCEIYGALDITNPFLTKNEYSFNQNLMRFGYSGGNLLNFKNHMQAYYEWAGIATKSKVIPKSPDFILIQKDLIDMMDAKIGDSVDDVESQIKNFRNFLYTEDNPDPKFKLFNLQAAEDINSVKNYLNEMIAKKKAMKIEKEAQKILDISKPTDGKDEIYLMIEEDLKNEPERRRMNELLKPVIKPKLALTSGNGFVDMMVLLSVITTCGAVAFIIAILWAR